jgi:hypothetical protein
MKDQEKVSTPNILYSAKVFQLVNGQQMAIEQA